MNRAIAWGPAWNFLRAHCPKVGRSEANLTGMNGGVFLVSPDDVEPLLRALAREVAHVLALTPAQLTTAWRRGAVTVTRSWVQKGTTRAGDWKVASLMFDLDCHWSRDSPQWDKRAAAGLTEDEQRALVKDVRAALKTDAEIWTLQSVPRLDKGKLKAGVWLVAPELKLCPADLLRAWSIAVDVCAKHAPAWGVCDTPESLCDVLPVTTVGQRILGCPKSTYKEEWEGRADCSNGTLVEAAPYVLAMVLKPTGRDLEEEARLRLNPYELLRRTCQLDAADASADGRSIEIRGPARTRADTAIEALKQLRRESKLSRIVGRPGGSACRTTPLADGTVVGELFDHVLRTLQLRPEYADIAIDPRPHVRSGTLVFRTNSRACFNLRRGQPPHRSNTLYVVASETRRTKLKCHSMKEPTPQRHRHVGRRLARCDRDAFEFGPAGGVWVDWKALMKELAM